MSIDIDKLIISKRIISRLLGQCFGVDGSFLSPLRACLSIFYTRICAITDKWDLDVSSLDGELVGEIKTFLKTLQTKLPSISPVSRGMIPDGSEPIGIDGQSDGSQWLSSWVFFLKSKDSETNKTSSRVANAGSKVKHHSVPGE